MCWRSPSTPRPRRRSVREPARLSFPFRSNTPRRARAARRWEPASHHRDPRATGPLSIDSGIDRCGRRRRAVRRPPAEPDRAPRRLARRAQRSPAHARDLNCRRSSRGISTRPTGTRRFGRSAPRGGVTPTNSSVEPSPRRGPTTGWATATPAPRPRPRQTTPVEVIDVVDVELPGSDIPGVRRRRRDQLKGNVEQKRSRSPRATTDDPELLRRHVVCGPTERHRLDHGLDHRRRLWTDDVAPEE